MANTLTGLIPVLYEALDVVSRELVGFIPAVSRDSSAERAAVGQTVRSPVVPEVALEDITPGDLPADSGDASIGYVDMSISRSKAAPVRWTGEEQRSVSQQYETIQRDRFAQAMRALCNAVEADVASVYHGASRAYGTAGTTPFADLSAMAEVLKILKDNGAPTDALKCVFDTAAGANLRSLTQLTSVNQAGTDRTLRTGALLNIHGFELRESGQVKRHTGGTLTLVTVTGDEAVGQTEIGVTTGATTGAVSLTAGDVITFGTGDDKYVVAADVTVGAGTTGIIKIAKPGLMVAVGAGEAVAVSADYTANLAFAQSAIHLVTRAPAMPEGGDAAVDVIEITDPVSGLAFQVAQYEQYRRVKYEVGLAWGYKLVKPEHVALLLG
jgi:hypothetical protein